MANNDSTKPDQLFIDELEPRLLFSAGLEGALLDDNLLSGEAAIVETISDAEMELLQQEVQQADNEPAATEVVFIDEGVENFEQLIADLETRANTDIYILDSSEDGISQISAVLQGYDNLNAVHLVSHGNEEGLSLGSGQLDNESMTAYGEAIAGWSEALGSEADLLIYGCDLAASQEGQALLAGLEFLTEADIAASDDLTGFAALGGDWDLEYQLGNIETSLAFSVDVQNNWQGVLMGGHGGSSPVISNLAGDSLAYTEGDGAQTIDQSTAVSVSDGGSNNDFSPGSLTVDITSGADNADDILSIRNQGTGAGQIGFDGSTVTYSGVTIGSINAGGGENGDSLIITFSGNPSESAVAALIQNITYENTDTDNPDTTTRTIQFVLENDDGLTDTETASVNLTAVNDAPTSADNTVNTSEDNNYTFAAGDFSFTDVDGDSLSKIKVNSLPANGTLELDGNPISANDEISDSDLGNLVFIPDADYNGSTTFTFQVHDGQTYSAGSYTMTMDVTAVNDAPTIGFLAGDTVDYTTGAGPLIIDQDTGINLSDVDSANFDGGTLTIGIPVGNDITEDVLAINDQGAGAGNISLSGSDITYDFGAGPIVIGSFSGGSAGADLEISLNASATSAAVTALMQNITYENTDGASPDNTTRTIRFSLSDGDGATSVNYDTNITINASNNAPTASDNTVIATEDTAFAFSASDFNFADADGGDALQQVQITTLPTNGTLTLYGVAVTVGEAVSVSDINSGMLKFEPESNSTVSDNFGFKVHDGTEYSAANYTMTVDITAVNDAPLISNLFGDTLNYTESDGALILDQGTSVSLSDVDSANFDGGSLTVSIPGNNIAAEDILAINHQGVGAGQIGVSGSNITYGGVLIGSWSGGSSGSDMSISLNANATPAAVEALLQNISYENANSANPSTLDRTVNMVLTDGDGGTSLSTDITVTISGTNDAPVAMDNTVTTLEDTNYTFNVSDFNFSDVDGDSLNSVEISSLPADGTLYLSDTEVSLNQIISQTDIQAGNLVFVPVADANGSGYAGFSYKVSDGTASSGSSYTMTIDVTPVAEAVTTTPATIASITYEAPTIPEVNIVETSSTSQESVLQHNQDENLSEDNQQTQLVESDESNASSLENADLVLGLNDQASPVILVQHNIHSLMPQLQTATAQIIPVDTAENSITRQIFSTHNQLLQQAINGMQNTDMQFDLQRTLTELNNALGNSASATEAEGNITIATATGVSIALTAGFITWALKGSSLFAAFITTLPAWHNFDPLPVLNTSKKNTAKQQDEENDDEIDSVFDSQGL